MSIRSPYRGLAAFEDSDLDALYFFGRERDTEIVAANLIASRLTVLYGPSGVGKSSLLLAAVSRSLRELPEQPLVVVFSSWTDDPESGLAAAIAEHAGLEPGGLVDVVELAQSGRDVYVILDQAEEYFTYHGDADGFASVLAELVNGPFRVNVLVSLREDTLARLDRLKGRIPNLFGNVLRLDRLDRPAARAAIVRPLDRWNELEGEHVEAEDALVENVLDGVGAGRIELGPGGLGAVVENGGVRGIEAPYLQLVMQRLWDVERAAGSTTLRAGTLEELGGAGQIVSDHLERAIEALDPEQQELAARLFHHLVTPSGTKIAHEASDLTQFVGASEDELRPVLAVLASHRILRTDESGRWEIFHDVLAGAVLGWKGRHDAERALAREREESRRRHRRLGILALGALVALAFAAGLTAWAFAERDRARQRAVEARAHELEARAVTLIPTDTSVAMALAAEAARTAPSVTAEDVLRQALLVDRLLSVVPAGGPVLDVAGAPRSSFLAAVGSGAARRYQAGPPGDSRRPEVDLEARYEAPATTVVSDPSGMLSASRDGTARLTPDPDAVSSQEPLTLRHRDAVVAIERAAACPADAGCLLTAAGTSLSIWDRRDGRRVGSIELATTVAELVPWSTTRVAVRTRDGRVLLADLTARRVERELVTPDRVDSIAADPARTLVAAGLADGSVLVWDTATGGVDLRYEPHLGSVLALDLANGFLLSGASDGAAAVRNLDTGRTVPLPGGHGNVIRSAELSADGRFAVTASADHTAKVWATKDGRLLSLLAGHGDVVTDAAFFVGSGRVVTGSLDGTLRTWESGTRPQLEIDDADPPPPPERDAEARDGAHATVADDVIKLRTAAGNALTLRGHRDRVNSVAFNADGSLLVSASRDHDARIWDARTGKPIHQLEGHPGSVADARFSPDGRWVVTAGPISAGLWNVRTGELVSYLRGPTSRPVAVGFGPDSRTIFSEEGDGVVRRYRCAVCGTVDDLRVIAEGRMERAGEALSAEERARYLG